MPDTSDSLYEPWQNSSGVVITDVLGGNAPVVPPPTPTFSVPPAPLGAPKVLKSRGGGPFDYGWGDELPAGTLPDIGDVTLIFDNQLI